MRMLNFLAIAALALGLTPVANATTRTIEFSYLLQSGFVDGSIPTFGEVTSLGVGPNETITGRFSFDDSGVVPNSNARLLPILKSLTVTTGTLVWTLADVQNIRDSLALDARSEVTGFTFDLNRFEGGQDIQVAVSGNSWISINVFTISNGRSVFSSGFANAPFTEPSRTSIVPLPASFPLLLVGFAVLLVPKRQRKN